MNKKVHYRIPGFECTACGGSWIVRDCSCIIANVDCQKCIDWYHKDATKDERPTLFIS